MPRRVLCIEGNETTRARVKSLLEARGFAVDTSDSGLDGISRALAFPPDLVIADVHLPDIEGYDLAARLKREGALARVPFVAVGDSQEDHDLALAAGADGFVERGADDERLGDEVRALPGREARGPAGGRASARGCARPPGSLAGHRDRGRGGAALLGARRRAGPAARRVHPQPRPRALDAAHAARRLPQAAAAGRLGPLSPQQQRVLDAMRSRSDASSASATTSPTSRACAPGRARSWTGRRSGSSRRGRRRGAEGRDPRGAAPRHGAPGGGGP